MLIFDQIVLLHGKPQTKLITTEIRISLDGITD